MGLYNFDTGEWATAFGWWFSSYQQAALKAQSLGSTPNLPQYPLLHGGGYFHAQFTDSILRAFQPCTQPTLPGLP